MADTLLFRRNLASIKEPALAGRIAEASVSADLRMVRARSGDLVPVFLRNGREQPLHSRFDPEKEGRRLAAASSHGFLVAFGLGGGFQLKPLLEDSRVTELIIVEKDLGLLRGILETLDLSSLLADSRVLLTVDMEPEAFERLILDRYLPLIHGGISSIVLRSRVDCDSDWFDIRARSLRSLIETLSSDYSVQVRFGRRWFINSLLNLPRSGNIHMRPPPMRRSMITAAGPSLEAQIPKIRALHRDGTFLIATDTSLPALSAASLVPDLVLSIDCQAISYHHFMRGLPDKTLLVLDLASPPLLARLTDRIVFFSSGHPFSLYLNRFYRSFPLLDSSASNVTHAALSLARWAGSQEVRLFGADYSYPQGRPYARGTYLFPHFQSRCSRMGPAENSFWTFIASFKPYREETGSSWRLRNAVMDRYRESLEKTAAGLPFRLIAEEGDGVLLRFSQDSLGAEREEYHAEAPLMDWRDFVDAYKNRLRALPTMQGAFRDYLETLETGDRQVLATLLPAAATFKDKKGGDAVEASRLWSLERLERLTRFINPWAR